MGKFVIFFVNLSIVGVTSIIGAFISLFWGLSLTNYIGSFCGLFSLQLFIGLLWTYHLERKIDISFAEIQSRNALTESIKYIELSCAYCASKNNVELLLNKENYFECGQCKQNNHISLKVATERTTKPLSNDNISDIFRKLDNPNG